MLIIDIFTVPWFLLNSEKFTSITQQGTWCSALTQTCYANYYAIPYAIPKSSYPEKPCRLVHLSLIGDKCWTQVTKEMKGNRRHQKLTTSKAGLALGYRHYHSYLKWYHCVIQALLVWCVRWVNERCLMEPKFLPSHGTGSRLGNM